MAREKDKREYAKYRYGTEQKVHAELLSDEWLDKNVRNYMFEQASHLIKRRPIRKPTIINRLKKKGLTAKQIAERDAYEAEWLRKNSE
jgi:hypothetical protein